MELYMELHMELERLRSYYKVGLVHLHEPMYLFPNFATVFISSQEEMSSSMILLLTTCHWVYINTDFLQ